MTDLCSQRLQLRILILGRRQVQVQTGCRGVCASQATAREPLRGTVEVRTHAVESSTTIPQDIHCQ
jgi:hypothetical protein